MSGRFCAGCGAAAGPELRFCGSCGAALPAAVPDPSSPVSDWASDSEGDREGDREERGRRPLVIAAVGLAALLAMAGGYVAADWAFGRDDAAAADEQHDGGSSTATPGRPGSDDPVAPRSVTASCQAPPGVDAANVPVTYEPANTLDGIGGTAWRCAGSAVGEQLVFDFGRPVTIASVGLVPGYDKVDPVDGTDRFGENRTVTAVTWRFDGGASHRQEIAAPGRAMARSRLDAPVTTSRLVLEIARTGNDGAVRDFTTISDVAFTGSD
ncbi:discoidin domain-containing protein [Blastococcus sp. CCUG 61487]|uniref:discoidin domain-containing protein n=1 Tax=Blastococcus sp. CCUG 61487 TaxID=1840703 RepID=UPI0010C0D98A|nr:discoidin domain-containing protein [Blastococcus sp. CCUG 61487]TKJ16523.1 hypothetical protein A6V29_13955 [Blastococcus sp. CCUG 61487]